MLGQYIAKMLEVVSSGLTDEGVAVGQEEDAFFDTGFPEPPNDLVGGIGLARASGHDEHEPLLPLGNGLHRPVDGELLVVAGAAATAVGVVVLGGDALLFGGGDAFVAFIALPEVGGAGELVEGEFLFDGIGV